MRCGIDVAGAFLSLFSQGFRVGDAGLVLTTDQVFRRRGVDVAF